MFYNYFALTGILVVLLGLMVSAATATIKELEPRRPHPYSSECVHFRLAVHRGNSKFSKGILGFATINDQHLYIGSSDDAAHFHFGRLQGLRYGFHKSWIAASPQSYSKGYGPLIALEGEKDGSPPVKRHTWDIGQKNTLEYKHKGFSIDNGLAEFCYRPQNSQIYGEFKERAPSKLGCKPITFVAQCVDKPPQQSDSPDIDDTLSNRRRDNDAEEDELQWKAARRLEA